MDNDMEDLMKGMDSLNSLTSSTRIVLLDTYGRAGVTTTRSLVIKPSNAGGLGIFTTEKIFAGEEIFRIDNPQFYFSFQEEEEEESKNVTCDFCLHSILSAVDKDGHIWTEACLHPEMKRCRGCYQVAYCSKECQRQAWVNHHKSECKKLSKEPKVELLNTFLGHNFSVPGLSTPLKLIRRILCLDADKQISPPTWDVISCLEAHSDTVSDVSDPRFEYIKRVSRTSRSMNEVKDIFSRILLNSYCMMSGEGTIQRGVLLDPFASLMNHSCDPNSFFCCDGRSFRVRSTQDIEEGGEITTSYVPLRGDYFFRKCRIQENYGFICKCSRCNQESQTLASKFESFPGVPIAQESIYNIWGWFLRGDHSDKYFKAAAAGISLIAQDAVEGKEWPEYLEPIPSCHVTLINLYQKDGKYYESFRNALRTHFVYSPIVFGHYVDVDKCYCQMLLVRALMDIEEYLNSPIETLPSKLQELGASGISELIQKAILVRDGQLELVILRARKVWGCDHTLTKALESLWVSRKGPLSGITSLVDDPVKIEELHEDETFVVEKFGVSKSERSVLLTTADN